MKKSLVLTCAAALVLSACASNPYTGEHGTTVPGATVGAGAGALCQDAVGQDQAADGAGLGVQGEFGLERQGQADRVRGVRGDLGGRPGRPGRSGLRGRAGPWSRRSGRWRSGVGS